MAFAKSAAAWLAVMGIAVAATGDGSGGGSGSGSGGSAPCNVDVRPNPGSSTCHRDGWCGGGGTVSTPGGTIVKGSSGVPCCFSESYVPPHDDLVPGNLKVVHTDDVYSLMILRKCDAPFTFLFIDIGKWSCDIEQETRVATYHVYTLGPCDDGGKSSTTPPE